MRNEPVPEKEFNEKKRAMVGSFALSLENPQQMIGYYVDELAKSPARRLLGQVP